MQEQEQLKRHLEKEFKKTNWWVTSSCSPITMETRHRTHKTDGTCWNDHSDINSHSTCKTKKDYFLDQICSESFIESVDTTALILFPVSFAVFQLWYWLGNFQESDASM
jgi:hypothetical protein